MAQLHHAADQLLLLDLQITVQFEQ
jgi:hypothetical protein